MKIQYYRYGFLLKTLVCLVMSLSMLQDCHAQGVLTDSLYWVQDTILDRRIDTIGLNAIRKQIYSGIRKAIKFSKKPDSYLQPDSIEHWNLWMRWAVILNDKQGLKLINDLLLRLQNSQHGDWQYYFEFMTLWAAYEGRVKGYSIAKKSEVVLSHFNNGNPIENDFYEQRLLDLGTVGIPHILAWARLHLISRMSELDHEMLSEADLAFPRLYNRFVIVFSSMINSENQKLIKVLLAEDDLHVQRFAKDVLDAAGY
ncbi:MAG TPA: hypothetical protein VI603_07365 [Saprospiraceae bacterium]|nr:hypothetical protein [Saprospiraceae bacterium]